MMRPIIALAMCLIANTCFAQTIKVEAFTALVAKSAKVIELPDSVAVVLSDSQGVKTGAYLEVKSDRKWATPVFDGIDIAETKVPGQWLMFAPPGTYRVLLVESDSEIRPRYSWHDVVIGNATTPPPVEPPPVAGDFRAITRVSREMADKLADPPTRTALASAYKLAMTKIAGMSWDESQKTVKLARSTVMNGRQGASRDVDWASWLKAVDVELAKVVPPGDAAKYLIAVDAIVKGLE